MFNKQIALFCCCIAAWSGSFAADAISPASSPSASSAAATPDNVHPASEVSAAKPMLQSAIIDAAPKAAAQVAFTVAASTEMPHPKKKHRPIMPGVETSTGVKLNTRLSRANIIKVSGDGTEIALVSAKFPNRIATPFAHPKIIDASSVVMQIDGSNIYLSPKGLKPFAIYITGDAPGDQVISMTLLPKEEIPAQTLILQLDTSSAAKRVTKPEGYTQQLVDLLRQVGAGRIPEGYSESRMPNMLAKQEGLLIVPEKRYSGSWLDIYRYRVQNNQSTTIELSETQFYQKGVKAVAIFPNVTLRNGDETVVFVIADKSILDQAVSDGK